MAKQDWGIEIPGGFFDLERHLYRNERGTVVPSSTQVFSILGMSDFSRVQPEVLEWKRTYGSAVHKAMEFLVVDDLDWESLADEIKAPVTGIDTRLREMSFNYVASEERRVVTYCGMQYGMTLDLRGDIRHRGASRKAVMDLKTGSKFEKYWMWQLGSYLIPQEPDTMGVILQVDMAGAITPHYVVDVAAAKREFASLLATTILMLNAGYASLGG